MIDSTSAIGTRRSANVVRQTGDVAIKTGKANEHSEALQLLAGESLTVSESPATYGAANKAATLVERDSADGRRKAAIQKGETLVSTWDFEGGATGRTHIDG